MTILFICKWNMGRSQIAEELFNVYSKKNKGISAGTNTIPNSKEKLSDVAPLTVKVLLEIGKNVSKKQPIKLTKKIAEKADKIVFMADKSLLPDYLKDSSNILFWEIADPDGRDYNFHKKMKDEIGILINDLINKID